MHLAELNIGKFKHPTSDPLMADFMNNLDRINALAERSEGFVWRLKAEGSNNATDLRVGDDYAVNLSVWTDAKALENYVFKTAHAQFYKRKEEFFALMEKPHMVFWPVTEGHQPTLTEARDRLEDYEKNGPSERAFGWAEVMDIERMRSLRCA
ncbi:MAG: DUF3291 domain-containing protein [Aestuariivirga sp.]